jgi:AraC-like DNA-binding protein
VAEDFLMSALYTVHLRRLLPSGAKLACWFTQPEPVRRDEHIATFSGAQLRFAAPRRGFSFERSLLATPIPSADPKLYRILVAQLERDLRELPEAPLFTERVRNLMLTETPLARSTLPTVASALKMSARTLARRLSSEGTSFGDLLDHVRRTRALAYLDEGQLRVEEVAAALGFSRSSAFHRAFKRWTGQSPSAYRLGRRAPRRAG